jgi:hypothetical protein
VANGTIKNPDKNLIDFSSQCTFPKGTPANFYAVTDGKMVWIDYQGPGTTYNVLDVLVRVPAQYQFADGSKQVHVPVTFNAAGTGVVQIIGAEIAIGQKPSISGNTRAYFQLAYPIA